uniref:Vasotocin-neurophysin VT-like n=1 Tax=Pseudonaja textilis TaxID=8673 RepID=A0A670YTG3_PSETE
TLRAFAPRQIPCCIRCGPGNRGSCFGPNICCGEEMGCYLGTPETVRCPEENFLPSPCEAGGKLCGADGRCAAPGICCNEESCTSDAACGNENGERGRMSPERNLTGLDGSTGDLLLRLMHLANKQQQQGKPQFY